MELVTFISPYQLLPFSCNTATSRSGRFESHLTLRQIPLSFIVSVYYSSQQSHSEFQPRRAFALWSSRGRYYSLVITYQGTEVVFSAPFPDLRVMEGTGDFDLETWVQRVGINTSGSLSFPRQFERSFGTKVPSTGTSAIVQKFKKAAHPPENNGISE